MTAFQSFLKCKSQLASQKLATIEFEGYELLLSRSKEGQWILSYLIGLNFDEDVKTHHLSSNTFLRQESPSGHIYLVKKIDAISGFVSFRDQLNDFVKSIETFNETLAQTS